MANVKISDLPAASAVADANEFEINEAGTSKRVTGAQISSKVIGDITSTDIQTLGALMDSELTSVVDVKAINQGLATTDTVQFGSIELGHASDTSLTRTGAGVIAVEGVEVTTNTATQTLTNKTLTTPTITLKQGTAPTPTAEGDIQWDTDDNKIVVGDGTGQKTFSDDAANAATYAAASHTHAASDITSGTLAAARLPIATSTEIRNETADKLITMPNAVSAAAFQTLTDGANISLDFDSGWNATVTLGGNRTLDNPTNVKIGMTTYLEVVQDATGSRTLSWGSYYKFVGGTAPTLSSGANDVDSFSLFHRSATEIHVHGPGANMS